MDFGDYTTDPTSELIKAGYVICRIMYYVVIPLWLGGQNSANVCPCECGKSRLIIGYKLSYTTGLLYAWSSCMQL